MKVSKLTYIFTQKFINLKIIIFSFLILFHLFYGIPLKNYYNYIRVCACTLGKNENKYIKEFVQHYENYGVDKIFLYDNNDIDGERFENVINDYYEKGFIDKLNWKEKKEQQFNIMNNCYMKNYRNMIG